MKVIDEINQLGERSSNMFELGDMTPTVTLAEAGRAVAALAREHAILLLSPPGVGKSDVVRAAAEGAGLRCRSLLGTQIAPEDVSGIPRIVGERSVFCPPRVLLPEDGEPFCLFLDVLPAAAPDVQKALYSLLLERRLGEHRLPEGSWVVAAGNRAEDHALVRAMSSALVNRVIVLHVRADADEWLAWARENGVRDEIVAFIACCPEALSRAPDEEAKPFSTPRAWAALSRALDRAEAAKVASPAIRRALAFGLLSASDAATFAAVQEERPIGEPEEYVRDPWSLPDDGAARWVILSAIRTRVAAGRLEASPSEIDDFLDALPPDHRFAVLVGLVERWSQLGARSSLSSILERVGA